MSQQLYANPLGTDGFEFVEFTSPDPQALGRQFEAMGFTAISRHRSKNVLRYRQGGINFILNMEGSGQAAEFRGNHGPSINAMAFRVHDAANALRLAVERGAKEVKGTIGPMELNIPAIEGIGGSYLYLVDLYGARENEGFGEGNFKALFESLELDQVRRGVLSLNENTTAGP